MSAALVLLNAALLASEQYEWTSAQRTALGRTHFVFLLTYGLELAIRASASGAAFFAAKWNQFELCTLALSLLGEQDRAILGMIKLSRNDLLAVIDYRLSRSTETFSNVAVLSGCCLLLLSKN